MPRRGLLRLFKTCVSRHYSCLKMSSSSSSSVVVKEKTVKVSDYGRGIQAYHFLPEEAPQSTIGCLVFVPGFMSHGKGTKALHLLEHCQKRGLECWTYDPRGLGKNLGGPQGPDFDPEVMAEVEFQDWIQDCRAVLDNVVHRKVLLVGSSLGGHTSAKMALDLPDLISGLVLIAPAINRLHSKYGQWLNYLSVQDRERVESGETIFVESEYGKMPVRKAFFDNYRKHEIDLAEGLKINCPVKIMHGMKDDVVPYEGSLELVRNIQSTDVDLILRKEGDHRLSSGDDLTFLSRILDSMI